MGRLKQELNSSYWRLWMFTIAPTGLLFFVAGWFMRDVIRGRFIRANQVMPPEQAFDASFTGGTFFTMTIGIMLVATLIGAYFINRLVLRPFRNAIALTREMAKGNYAARATIRPKDGNIYREMVGNINALAESLERTERLRREVVATLAHEIRTPLTNLEGYLEAMRDGVIEANQNALDSVYDEVMRLVRLVDALHKLARADALRQQPLRFSPTDLDGLVEQMVRVIRPNAEARGISVSTDLGCGGQAVPVHADSIAQVIRNLLRNAVQYTDEGGSIRIQASVVDRAYRLTCLNSGEGISPTDLPFIFRRFYRSERAKQMSVNGVGIGLAICKELVEVHGGRIGADSKAGWTVIWFELPTEAGMSLDPDPPSLPE